MFTLSFFSLRTIFSGLGLGVSFLLIFPIRITLSIRFSSSSILEPFAQDWLKTCRSSLSLPFGVSSLLSGTLKSTRLFSRFSLSSYSCSCCCRVSFIIFFMFGIGGGTLLFCHDVFIRSGICCCFQWLNWFCSQAFVQYAIFVLQWISALCFQAYSHSVVVQLTAFVCSLAYCRFHYYHLVHFWEVFTTLFAVFAQPNKSWSFLQTSKDIWSNAGTFTGVVPATTFKTRNWSIFAFKITGTAWVLRWLSSSFISHSQRVQAPSCQLRLRRHLYL